MDKYSAIIRIARILRDYGNFSRVDLSADIVIGEIREVLAELPKPEQERRSQEPGYGFYPVAKTDEAYAVEPTDTFGGCGNPNCQRCYLVEVTRNAPDAVLPLGPDPTGLRS